MELSWPTKRLIMAEIDNATHIEEQYDQSSNLTIETAIESLLSGYRPYDEFPVYEVKEELLRLQESDGDLELTKLVTEADWERRIEEHKQASN